MSTMPALKFPARCLRPSMMIQFRLTPCSSARREASSTTGPVGHGIGERHADSDHAPGAVGVQFFNDAPERVERGEACGDEGNERRASGCVRIPYFLFKKTHDGAPRYASGGKGGYRPP